ncbi:hypothetical protein [Microtetraspora sp. NBRC 13810]|uniref:hypothetical protein n=1 Tax=Microtetraspora sp. NBRC 13810 TaxID=3030990 RepID=UPI0025537CF2|nr:hypothetical protein [Microtetraspora sp. NBRC 13810]
MTTHTISTVWDDIPADADDLVLVQGGYRSFGCACGTPLPDRVAAELHAMEHDRCSSCLGAATEEIVPGYVRRCVACAGTGRRRDQLIWQLAYNQAETTITVSLVRSIVAQSSATFTLSEVADAVRATLGLRPGRLPVGPRVRDVLHQLEAAGELVLLSAPDELLRGASVVLYRDPRWRRAA